MGTLQDSDIISWEDALSLYERYENHSDVSALELAIRAYRELLDRPPNVGVPDRYHVLSALGQALTRRFQRLEHDRDLDEALSFQKDALELAQGTDHIAAITDGLVRALCLDFDIRGKVASCEEAVFHGKNLLDLTPQGSDNHAVALITAAVALFTSYKQSDSKTSLEEGRELARRGVQLCSRDHKVRPRGLYVLAVFPLIKSRCSPEDLTELGVLLQSALLLRPPGHCDRVHLLNALSLHANSCFIASGNVCDLDKQIAYRTEALSLCPVGNRTRSVILYSLASDFAQRATRAPVADSQDFDRAVEFAREGLSLHWRNDVNRYYPLHHLAETLRLRFFVRGPSDLDDVDEAVSLLREALNIHPRGHRCHNSALLALGRLFCARYERGTRELRDINRAIELLRDGFATVGRDADWKMEYRQSVAYALYLRYQHLHCVEDSIEGLALIDDSLKGNVLQTLHSTSFCVKGGFLLTRFDYSGIESDLDEAISAFAEAADLSSASNQDHMEAFSLLTAAHTRRCRLNTSSDTIEAARVTYSRFGELCPIDHPARALWLLNLAEFEAQLGADSLLRALQLTHDALIDNNCSAQWRLESALRVFELIGRCDIRAISDPRDVADKALRSYIAAAQLLPEVAVLGLDIADRLRSLSHTFSLVVSTIDFGVICGRLEHAVEIVEQCRSFFWSQALRLRTPLGGLPTELREEIARLRLELERESFVLRPVGPSPMTVALADEHGNVRRRKQTEELKGLAKQARSYHGFERFMLHDEFKTLAFAAARGPVVLLFPSTLSTGANAVMLQPSGHISHLHLPEADQTWLTNMKATWNDVMVLVRTEVRERILVVKKRPTRTRPTAHDAQRRVLESLWKSVVKPVLDHLGFKKADGCDRPRLWWCCGGDFTFLPLHATGVGDEGCWNYVVSSYTPSLTALLATRASDAKFTRAKARVLLSAVPSAGGGFIPLPSTVHEVTAIAKAIPATTRIPLPPTEDPLHAEFAGGITVQTMMDNIQDANVLHLACHATQHADNPLESAFILRDGPLSIAQLMPVPLPNAFLAFLSACETAKGDAKYPEQTIHLGATMIVSLQSCADLFRRSMDDVDGPVVARKVYERLFEGDSEFLDPDRIPYALDEAVGLLRAQGLPPGRWAPYIHLGL